MADGLARDRATTTTNQALSAHGGSLLNLYLAPAQVEAKVRALTGLPALVLTPRQACDLELLLNGAFSPLTGFLKQADYQRVLSELRLADGTLWSIPITLDVSEAFAAKLQIGGELVLTDVEGAPNAVLNIEELYRPDRALEAQQVFGSSDLAHPGVRSLLQDSQPVYVGGSVQGLRAPRHFDFNTLRLSPRELRERLAQAGHARVVAFQTRNPLHRAHKELTERAAKQSEAHLLLHPVVGLTKPGDVDHFTRVRCYQALLPHYAAGTVTLALLNLAMRMAGPREALWHAIIRKNFGATAFIVGRDHAGPGNNSQGQPFYSPYAAQELTLAHAEELGIAILPFSEVVYAANRNAYLSREQLVPGDEVRDISGTELRRLLHAGEELPTWYTFPEVAKVLQERHPPKNRRGVTVFFTGLSGSGKSTLAQGLLEKLLERSGRPATLLDGDEVLLHLSKGLGFCKEDRSTNIRRIGYVAAEISRHGGISIAAPIAPYTEDRLAARLCVEGYGAEFIEVHVSTPIEVCEARDRKGLYAKARAGELKGFTGIDDPYEAPTSAELVLDASTHSAEELVGQILAELAKRGLVA